MAQEKQTVTIQLDNRTLVLSFQEFDTDIDVEDLTRIHYENIFGELVTVSALLNRVGIIKADCEAMVKTHRLETDIYRAELEERFRRELTIKTPKVRSEGMNIEKPSSTEVSNNAYLDPVFQNKLKKQYRLEKELAYVDSLYWAVQSKDKKLSGILKGITPKEFESEIVEGVVNGFLVQSVENLIPSVNVYKPREQ